MSGRFATTSYAFEREVRDVSKKQPRLKTHNYGQDLITGATDPNTYSRQYYARLVERLMAQNIATSGFVFSHFRWAVPGPASTATQLATWEMIDRCPMIVSDTELQTVFKMQESTLQSPETPEGLRILYLRTWPISPPNLRFLLDRMISQGIFFEEFRAWDNVLSIYEAAAENVAAPERLYDRYVGETEGPKRPIDRQSEDEQGREYGVMPAVLKAVEEFLPDVHRERKVWTLTNGCLSEESYLSIENNERMAIQLFGPATLINRQRGGYYASYIPSSGDAATFRNMRTDFWARFVSGAGLPSADMQSQLDHHFKNMQQYANDHPAETGTAQVGEFSDQWTEVVQQQATPFQYKGFTIAAWLGKDVTREEYVAKGVFINGKSRAGHLTRDFIHRLVREESLQHRGEFPVGSFNPSRGPWCFVDLWSWPWHRNFTKAAEFLRQYMGIVQPLIAITLSKDVNGLTRADFVHGNGVAMAAFIHTVGVPTIQHYTAPGIHSDEPQAQEDTAFINIPHIHPGKDKYGNQDLRLRRVLDLTMQLTFLLAHIALEYIDKLASSGGGMHDQQYTRSNICTEVLRRFEHLRNTSAAHKAFVTALNTARNDLAAYWSDQRGANSVSIDDFFDERPRLVPEGFVMINSLGRAIHPPGSVGRANQLADLWEQNMPDLHSNVPHTKTRRAEWLESLLSVDEGTFYYVKVLADAQPDEYSRKFFQNFRTGRVKNKEWFNTVEARTRAIRDASDFISVELEKLEMSGDLVGNTASQSSILSHLSPKDCHNRRVEILINGVFRIRFIHPEDGRYVLIESLCKPAKAKDSSLRYMRFTEHGIDIVGARGEVFRRDDLVLTQTKASIPLSHIQGNVDFVTLWRTACEAHGISTAALHTADGDDVREWGPAGVAPLGSQAKSEKPKQNRPLRETDGNWLLQEFINSQDHLRDGGVFHTALRERFPDSAEDLQHFLQFIKGPEYQKHPYYYFWIKNLDGEKASAMGVLSKNLPLLRDSVRKYRQGKSANKNLRVAALDSHAGGVKQRVAQVHENYYVLGAPGSALPDPWKKSGNQSCLPEKDRKENTERLKEGKPLTDGEDSEVEKSVKKSSKKKPKKAKREDSSGDDVELALSTTSKALKKGTAKQKDLDDEIELPSPKKSKRTSTKSTKRTIKQHDSDVEMDQPEAKKLKPSSTKSTRRTIKQNDPPEVLSEERMADLSRILPGESLAAWVARKEAVEARGLASTKQKGESEEESGRPKKGLRRRNAM